MEYNFFQLTNGIRVVHKYVNSNVAHCGLIINTGSRDEDEKENGIAHFIEHCIFKGTEKRKSFHILNRLDSVGGDLNAYTTKEETCVYASFLDEYFERTIELLSDIVFNSNFPPKELIKEKEVVIEEINSYKDNPSELIYDEYEEYMFAGHPIGRLILGTPANVRKFNSINLRHFIQKHYNTDEMVLCAVGNIKFPQLLKLVNKHFESHPANLRQNSRIPFTGYKPINITKNKRTYQTHTIIGNMAFDTKDKRKNALTVLNNLLGGPAMNTRLNLAVRERHGYAYTVDSTYTPYSDTGLFNIYLGTDNGSNAKAIDVVLKELLKLRTIKLGNLQLSSAKKQLMGQVAIAYESNLNEMLSIGKSYMLFNKIDSNAELCAKIEKVTSEEIIEIANEIFEPSQLSFLIYKSK